MIISLNDLNDRDEYTAKVDEAKALFYKLAEDKKLSFRRRWLGLRKSSFEELIETLSHYDHNYDTICHAVTAAAIGAAWSMNRQSCGGITGFQASYVMWQFIMQWMHYENKPMKLMHYNEMLYPQSGHKFEKTITPSTWEYLQAEAKKMLEEKEGGHVHPEVAAHLKSIVEGVVPFDYIVKE